MAKKDWAAATKALTELRKTQPDNPLVWYAVGHLHTQLGNYEIAIEQYKQAIAIKQDFTYAYRLIGDAYGALQRYPEAIEAHEQYLRLEPTGELSDPVREDLPRLRRLAGK